jgi:hypothetical protein
LQRKPTREKIGFPLYAPSLLAAAFLSAVLVEFMR